MKIFLVIFFLGSSVFASSIEKQFADVEPSDKKDLSVFVSRLGERMKGVFREIVILSTDGVDSINSNESINTAVVGDFGVNLETQRTLIDVDGHKYQDEILAMVDLGVFDSNREKFYPDNYLRRYEFVIMLVKYRLAKDDKQIPSMIFPLRGWFFDVAQNDSYASYVAYAEQQGWISKMISEKDGKKKFSPNKFLTKKEVCALLNADLSNDFCSIDLIKRGEFVSILSHGFVNVSKNVSSLSKNSSLIKQVPYVNSQQGNNNKIISQAKTMFSLALRK